MAFQFSSLTGVSPILALISISALSLWRNESLISFRQFAALISPFAAAIA